MIVNLPKGLVLFNFGKEEDDTGKDEDEEEVWIRGEWYETMRRGSKTITYKGEDKTVFNMYEDDEEEEDDKKGR